MGRLYAQAGWLHQFSGFRPAASAKRTICQPAMKATTTCVILPPVFPTLSHHGALPLLSRDPPTVWFGRRTVHWTLGHYRHGRVILPAYTSQSIPTCAMQSGRLSQPDYSQSTRNANMSAQLSWRCYALCHAASACRATPGSCNGTGQPIRECAGTRVTQPEDKTQLVDE